LIISFQTKRRKSARETQKEPNLAKTKKRHNTISIFKELIDELPDEYIILFINALFDRNYPTDAKVTRLATESRLNGAERRSDIIIGIKTNKKNNIFCIELQSQSDMEITLRIFEYSCRAALQHGKTQDEGFLTLDFPQCVVFYLRSGAKTPKELTITLNLPDGSTTGFKIPVKKLEQYSPHELTEDSKIILSPFYPILYEGSPLKTADNLKKLESEVLTIIDKIKHKADSSAISQKAAELIVSALKSILNNVIEKSNVPKREAESIMEAAAKRYYLEPLNWRAEGKAEGILIGEAKSEAKGIIKGKIEAAKKMFAKGFSFDDVRDITGLSTQVLEQIKAESAVGA